MKYFLLIISIFPSLSLGSVSLDSSGWTIISPSSDSRIVYVSNSIGNDSFNGLSPSTPKKTITAGNALIRDGYPDHLLLKRGDVFPVEADYLLGRWKSGRSAQEPMVLSYYGDEGERPVVKITRALVDHNGQSRDFQAFIGIEIYKSDSDPFSPDFANAEGRGGMRFVGGGRNLLIEDCRLRFIELVIQSYGGHQYSNIKVRRNMIVDAWKHNSSLDNKRISGIYMEGVKNSYLIEENFFDHNGWNTTVANAGANMYNHNAYIQYSNVAGGIIRGNIFSRAAAHGLQARSGGIVERNLFVLNAISFNLGGYRAPTEPGVNAFNNRATQNVVLNGRRMDPNNSSWPRTTAVWGIIGAFIGDIRVEDNVIANRIHSGNVLSIDAVEQPVSMIKVDNVIYNWRSQDDQFNAEWPHPEHDLGDYYATLGGTNDTIAYLEWQRNRPVRTLSWEMTAYSAINYIRAGFNKPPVTGYYEYESSLEPDPQTWAGLTISESWVNTGENYLGNLYVANPPWVFSEYLDQWLYLPEENYSNNGSWIYFINPTPF